MKHFQTLLSLPLMTPPPHNHHHLKNILSILGLPWGKDNKVPKMFKTQLKTIRKITIFSPYVGGEGGNGGEGQVTNGNFHMFGGFHSKGIHFFPCDPPTPHQT